jgi:hypothetical protein
VKFVRGWNSGWLRAEGGQKEGAQKRRQTPQGKAEVVAGGGEDGVDAVVPVWSVEIVAVHAMVGLE